MILAFLALTASVAPTEGSPALDCLRSDATTLERSGDTPSEVARAVIADCIPPGGLRPDSPLGPMAPDEQKRVLDIVRQIYSDRIILRIERVRACRKTPGCNISRVPWTGL